MPCKTARRCSTGRPTESQQAIAFAALAILDPGDVVLVEEPTYLARGAPFYAGEPDRATLRLAFTTRPPDAVREGLERLGTALAKFLA